jgi:hypothetical protein
LVVIVVVPSRWQEAEILAGDASEDHALESHEVREAVVESAANRLGENVSRVVEIETVELANATHGMPAMLGAEFRDELAELRACGA